MTIAVAAAYADGLPSTQPQQAKVIADTGKRLGVLFDMLNCETLSPASTSRVLEICRGALELAPTAFPLFFLDPPTRLN